MRTCLLLIAVLLALPTCLCFCDTPPDSNDEDLFAPWLGGREADKLFPKPPILLEYERIRKAYDAGRVKEELPQVRKLANQPICLGSSKAWADDPNNFYFAYVSGRLIPAMAIIRWVWHGNSDYAKQLGKNGKHSDALAIYALNLAISRQVVHIQPPESTCLLSGHGLWQASWIGIRDELRAVGDRERATQADNVAKQSRSFLVRRIHPVVEQGSRESQELQEKINKLPKSKREKLSRAILLEYLKADQYDWIHLNTLWDMEVDTVACRQLVKELQKEYQTDTALTPTPAK